MKIRRNYNFEKIENSDLIQLYSLKKRYKLTCKSIVDIAMDIARKEKIARRGHDILIVSIMILILFFLFVD